MTIKKELFGKLDDGREAYLYTLTNKNNMRLLITNFGGRMVQLWVPDRSGRFDDIIAGYDTLAPYLARNPYFGALVGRYANRINKARFSLNGKTFKVDANMPPDQIHHLHGGSKGFSYLLWDGEPVEEPDGGKLKLRLASPDGDMGFPGKLDVEVIYTLTKDNSVSIKYFAKTDADTIINMTNHVHFNLKGHNKGNILDHLIRIDADYFLPTDPSGIPVGRREKVEGTPFDLRKLTQIGSKYNADNEQLAQQSGFDYHFFLDNGPKPKNPAELRNVCEVREPAQGRKMEVWTTKPGVQLYMGNKFNGTHIGKGGHAYQQYANLCLETQYPPDGPNGPDRELVILRPGQEYRHETVYAFSVI